jgi:hypothetical protein
MNNLSMLLNAKNEAEFFLLFYALLKEPGSDFSLQMKKTEYEDEFALQVVRTQMQTHMKGASQVFSPEITHVFTLTLSGKLVWQMLGEEKPIVGLAAIKSKLRDIQRQHTKGDQFLSAHL